MGRCFVYLPDSTRGHFWISTDNMPRMKTPSDLERFQRYQSVVNTLLARESFSKPEIYEALEILLNRPEDFDTGKLKALRKALATNPDSLVDKFTEKNLRRAYNKEVADIISIIRHAATGSELLTAEQRVNKAMMKVKSDRAFNEEQQKWLELIRRHLTENLIMEKEDVDSLPIFARQGASWVKLNKLFGGELETIIDKINTAIAA